MFVIDLFVATRVILQAFSHDSWKSILSISHSSFKIKQAIGYNILFVFLLNPKTRGTDFPLIPQQFVQVFNRQVNSMITDYPYVAVLHTLLGNTRYLAKDFRQAYAAYTRALELDPENLETRKMVKKLDQMVAPPAQPAKEEVEP